MFRASYDVVIVGGGPNGLTAAAVLAASGLSVAVCEAAARIGGGCRTEAVTLPGFVHDLCAAIHPMGVASPILRRLDLEAHGVRWISAPAPLAHPFDDGHAAVLGRGLDETARRLGGADGRAWTRLLRPFVDRGDAFFADILRPVRWPRHPWLMARFGRLALRSSDALVDGWFSAAPARALFGGCAAHACVSLAEAGSAAFGLALAAAGHAVDWPCAAGGSERIVEALAAVAQAHGCELHTGVTVRALRDLPAARAVLFDLTPRQVAAIAGEALGASERRARGAKR
jgi:phytoene dehydrogenase-like protein